MNTRSQSAVSIITTSMGTAIRPHGGGLASIPCSWPRELWRQSHSTPIG
jgi:hypothetical protein